MPAAGINAMDKGPWCPRGTDARPSRSPRSLQSREPPVLLSSHRTSPTPPGATTGKELGMYTDGTPASPYLAKWSCTIQAAPPPDVAVARTAAWAKATMDHWGLGGLADDGDRRRPATRAWPVAGCWLPSSSQSGLLQRR
jgi:hypothetical protein